MINSNNKWISSMPIYSAEEERELFVRYFAGDMKAKEEIIKGNLRLVAGLARRKSMSSRLSFDDLVQEGSVGLLRAIDKFDLDRGVRFYSYAQSFVRDEMRKFTLRNARTVPVFNTGKKYKTLYPLMVDVVNNGNRLTHEQAKAFAAKVDFPVSHIYNIEAGMLRKDYSYLEISTQDDIKPDQDSLGGLPSAVLSPEEELEHEDSKHVMAFTIKRAMNSLNDRKRDIIRSRWLGDKKATLLELSQRHAVSQERIRQLEKESLQTLREVVA